MKTPVASATRRSSVEVWSRPSRTAPAKMASAPCSGTTDRPRAMAAIFWASMSTARQRRPLARKAPSTLTPMLPMPTTARSKEGTIVR